MSTAPVPAGIEVRDGGLLVVTWDEDGALVTDHPARLVRLHCHCAVCVQEVTGERLLDPNAVPEDVTITSARLTGQYGIALDFSDGHRTGIYSWASLHELIADPDMQAAVARAGAEDDGPP